MNMLSPPLFQVGEKVVHPMIEGLCLVTKIKLMFGYWNYFLLAKKEEPFWTLEDNLSKAPRKRVWDEEDI